MRTAYSGRAAAYFAKRDYEKAIADQSVVVLIYGLEVDLTKELKGPDQDELLRATAAAYRMRADILIAAGLLKRAESDLIRAETLETEARKQSAKSKEGKTNAAPSDTPH